MKYNREYSIKNKEYDEIKRNMNNYQYEEALDLLVIFNQKYPDDVFGKFDYAKCLIKTDNINSGIEELEKLRKGNIKKIAYKLYGLLLDNYAGSDREKIDGLLLDAKKVLNEFEYGLFKAKYYYCLGLCNDAESQLFKLKISSEKEKSKIKIIRYLHSSNEYLKINRKKIEKELKQYLNKKYISEKIARSIYLKLYIACSDYEEAYKYMSNEYNSGIKSLITCYEICVKLDKKEEAKKYLSLINNSVEKYDIKELSVMKAQILYLNGKKEEAFEICRDIAVIDEGAALKTYEYGIQLGKIDEVIEALEEVVENTPINNRKIVKIIEQLCSAYICKNEYQKAYKLYIKYKKYISKPSKKMYKIYFSKKFGYESKIEISKNEYLLQQVNEYNYEAAFNRILKYMIKNKDEYNEIDKKIVEDFLKKISLKLIDENLHKTGIIKEYEIDCSNLGINESRVIVGTLGDTNNIIYCHPIKFGADELDFDEEIDTSKEKIYIKSGLERFNKKYKNFLQNK